MMIPSKELLIGYDYDAWYGFGNRVPVTVDASTKNNSQTLICGMSGSGKSYLLEFVYMGAKIRWCILQILSRMIVLLIFEAVLDIILMIKP